MVWYAYGSNLQVGWIGIARRYLAMPIDTHTELHSKAIRTPSSPLLLSHIYERTWLHRHSESIGVPIVCGAEATRYAYQSEGGEGNGRRTRHRRGKTEARQVDEHSHRLYSILCTTCGGYG